MYGHPLEYMTAYYAVSYTHLDVYKRQHLLSLIKEVVIVGQLEEISRELPAHRAIRLSLVIH